MKTRELLIDAALTLFAANDYGNVTTRKIVAEAGVALPTLHRHFDTKENLFREMLKHTYGQLYEIRDDLIHRLSEAQTHREIIEEAVRTFVDFAFKDPRILRTLVRMGNDPSAPRDQYFESRNTLLDYVVELLPSQLEPDVLRVRVQVYVFGFSRLVTIERSEICAIMGTKSWRVARPRLEQTLVEYALDAVKLAEPHSVDPDGVG